MKRNRLAFLFAMSLAAFGAGCGDGGSKPDAPLGEAGGWVPGMDGAAAEAGPRLDLPLAVDAGVPDAPLPVDVGGVVDAPLPIDVGIAIEAPAVDVPVGETGLAIDSLVALEAGRIDAAACAVLPNRFDTDTVLPKGCYLAQRSPIIAAGVRLTLSPGAWDAIIFDNTRDTPNVLDHCLIEFGGGNTAAGHHGMVIAQSDSRGVALALTNSRIENSGGYGLYMGRYAEVDATGSTFAGNVSGATFKEP
jgi:hypothetical protein